MEELLKNQKTMILCSLNMKESNLSYVPFVTINEKFYAYITEISEHYNDILNDDEVKIMIIEDESISKTTFMRRRAVFNGIAKIVDDNEEIFKILSKIHGEKMIEILRRMDFHILEIKVKEGKITKGFGKSYKVYWNDGRWIEEKINLKNHKYKTES